MAKADVNRETMHYCLLSTIYSLVIELADLDVVSFMSPLKYIMFKQSILSRNMKIELDEQPKATKTELYFEAELFKITLNLSKIIP